MKKNKNKEVERVRVGGKECVGRKGRRAVKNDTN